MRRAVLYARVSSDAQEREGYSLDAQTRLLREHAGRLGLEVAAELVEVESAKAPGRPQFERALKLLRSDAKDAPRVLVADKIDRLTRNLRDYLALDELVQAGVEIHAAREGLTLGPDADPSTSLMWGMQVLWARQYVERLSREVRKGLREKAERGGWAYKAPLGYLNSAMPDGRRGIVLDPVRAPLLRAVAERIVADSLTIQQATDYAYGIGLRSKAGARVHPSALWRLLRHPLLGGWIPIGTWTGHPWGGTAPVAPSTRAGSHEPVLPPELWLSVQRLLDGRHGGRRGRKGVRRDATFSGLLRCACGRQATTEHHRGRSGKGSYRYYRCAAGPRCTAGTGYWREARIVEIVSAELARLRLDPADVEDLRRHLTESRAAQTRVHEAALSALDSQRRRLAKRLDVLYEDRLDGRITAADYDRRSGEIRAEQDALETKRAAHQVSDRAAVDAVLEVFDVCQRAGELFAAGSAEERRSIFTHVAEGSRLRRDGLEIAWRPWFKVVLDAPASLKRDDASSVNDLAPTLANGAHSATRAEPPRLLSVAHRVALALAA